MQPYSYAIRNLSRVLELLPENDRVEIYAKYADRIFTI